MNWEIVGIIIGCVSGVGSAFALIFWAGRQFQKLDILWGFYSRFWDFFLFEGLKATARKGWASQSSPWQLTDEGEKALPEEIKREVKSLIPSLKQGISPGEEAAFLIQKLDPEKLRSLALQREISFQEAMGLIFAYAEQIKQQK